MAILLLEGFEDDGYFERMSYQQGIFTVTGPWGSGSRGMGAGDNNNSYWQFPAVSYGGGATELWVSFQLYVQDFGVSGGDMVKEIWGSGSRLEHGSTANDLVWVVNGVTLTANGALSTPASWNWVQLHVVYSATVGSMEIFVNNSSVASNSSVNTGTPSSIPISRWGGNTTADTDDCRFDDIMFNDNTGSANNTRPSLFRIYSIHPEADGTYSQLTGQDGNQVDNWQNVNDSNPSSADYNESDTEGELDTYTMEDVPTTGNVYGITTHTYMGLSAAGTKYMRPVLRSGSNNYNGTSQSLTASMAHYQEIYDQNPNGPVDWTTSTLNAIELGAEVRDS